MSQIDVLVVFHHLISCLIKSVAFEMNLWRYRDIKKLNPLRARWPTEPALVTGFCSVKQMRVFDSPWTGH